MSGVPSLPLFVDDYEAATAHLSVEEDGAYLRLLRLCWRTPGCSVPDDPQWIARKMRVDDATFERVVVPVIREFFRRSRGRLFQKRLRAEFCYVSELSRVRKEAGKKGGSAKAQKTKGNGASKDTGLPEQPDSKAVAPTLTLTPTLSPEDKSSGRPKADVDPDVEFWTNAKAFLKPFTRGDPGALVGKWLREQGKELTIGAITAAQVERAVNPVEYIPGYFRRHGRGHAEEGGAQVPAGIC